MSVILSMETFSRLEAKLGTESAKEVYQLAEAIYEEIAKKTEEKLKNYKLDFADDEYKRLTRKELNEFKEELKQIQQKTKEEFATVVNYHVGKLSAAVKVIMSVMIVNLAVSGLLLYSLLKP